MTHSVLPGERDRYVGGEPLRIGTRRVLLIDDFMVEDRWNIRRVMNRPVKHPANPLVVGDKPWDISPFLPSVLFDAEAGIFRMWYAVFDWFAFVRQFRKKDWTPDHGYPYFMCYAESPDGINWKKPELGLIDYRGWKQTNVGMVGRQKCQAFRVIPNPPSTGQPGRFLLNYKDNLPGAPGALCLAYSDDGIHWRPDPANPVMMGLRDTNHNLVYDDERERWLLFTRPMSYAGQHKMTEADEAYGMKSRTAVSIGETPYSFGYPRNVIWTEEDENEKIDQNLVNKVGAHFIGFKVMMDGEGRTDTHLGFSRDGLYWQRLPGAEPYLARGREGDFDFGEAMAPKNIVPVDDWYYLYYSGHQSSQHDQETLSSIGLAMVHRDRFVAQVGGEEGGYLLTREFLVEGDDLQVNVAPMIHHTHFARFAAEVIRVPKRGWGPPEVVEGYSFADCDAEPHDLLDYSLTWQGKNLAPLRGTSVQIRFYLRNVGLYAMQMVSLSTNDTK